MILACATRVVFHDNNAPQLFAGRSSASNSVRTTYTTLPKPYIVCWKKTHRQNPRPLWHLARLPRLRRWLIINVPQPTTSSTAIYTPSIMTEVNSPLSDENDDWGHYTFPENTSKWVYRGGARGAERGICPRAQQWGAPLGAQKQNLFKHFFIILRN